VSSPETSTFQKDHLVAISLLENVQTFTMQKSRSELIIITTGIFKNLTRKSWKRTVRLTKVCHGCLAF